MEVDVNKLKKLVAQGRVTAHNDGPPPELVIQLFETKPEIWCAVYVDFRRGVRLHIMHI